MKLTNQQINALASKFYNELNESKKVKNEEKKARLKEQFRSDYNKGIKLLEKNDFLKSVEIKIKDNYTVSLSQTDSFEDYVDNWNIERVINKLIDDNHISSDSIKDDIILATIDTSSVDEIMEVLKTKYK